MASTRRRSRQSTIPGMLKPLRPIEKSIDEMDVTELRNLYSTNQNKLSTMSESSSNFVTRVNAEQAKIKVRLDALESLEKIQNGMRTATLDEFREMSVDKEETYISPAMEAKQRALANWGKNTQRQGKIAVMDFNEAIELERQAHTAEQARLKEIEEKKAKQAMPTRTTEISREEYEAKVWAFMTYKATDSDMEGEDDDDDDDDDPASWFEDDQDDGLKGQDIVYPDPEEYHDVIRIDESRIPYNSFYGSFEGD